MARGRSVHERRIDRTAVIVGSATAHLLVLLVLGLMVPKPRFRTLPQPPMLQFRLISLHPRPLARSASSEAAPVAAPLHVHAAPPTNAPPSPIVAGSPKAAPGPAVDNGTIHFYDSGSRDCAKEDLMLLSPEERIHCSPKLQTADGTGGRIIPGDRAPISGIDPAKRAAWDQQLAQKAARRDGAEAQADLKAIQDARGPFAPNRTFDINAGFSCKFAFGANAKKGLDALSCKGSYPKP